MQKNIATRLAMLILTVPMVLPVYSSVKHLSSNRVAAISAARASGSPLPAPPPPGLSIVSVSGSPLPAPPPPGFELLASSGSPLPAPPPPRYDVLTDSGSPLPAPPPPRQMAEERGNFRRRKLAAGAHGELRRHRSLRIF